MTKWFRNFMSDGCGCALGAKGGPCSKQFSNDTVLFNLNNCLELSSGELDLVILASIQAFTQTEAIGEKRNRSPQCSFFFQSKPICKDMFMLFYEADVQASLSSGNFLGVFLSALGHWPPFPAMHLTHA